MSDLGRREYPKLAISAAAVAEMVVVSDKGLAELIVRETAASEKPGVGDGSIAGDRLALTAFEAAAALGVSERHLTSLAARDEVPHVHLGHRIVFPVEALREHLRAKCARFFQPSQEATASHGEAR